MYKVVLVQGPTWTCLVLIDSKVKRALIIYSRGAEPSEHWGRGGPHPPYFGRLVNPISNGFISFDARDL